MLFAPQALAGLVLIEPQRHEDARGFFGRVFCEDEFAAAGLVNTFPQHSVSFNLRQGTVRGMHFQRAPCGEVKVIRCTHGAIRDVVVDVREGSETFGRYASFDLTAHNHLALYVPEGFAHGFQTLTDATEVSYLISRPFEASAASGIRFDDPAIAIEWPLPITCISAKDREWPLLGDPQ